MNKYRIATLLLVVAFLAGCNLPATGNTTPPPDTAAYTQAAQTVVAALTQAAGQASPTPNVLPATNTPLPTNTPVAPATNTPLPCNAAVFVTDVTIPDNTVIPAGGAFTKTWRLRNVGTCTWNSTYQLVYISGDALGVPTGFAQALTAGFISPTQDVDATVNLTAPTASGTYTGRWGFRDGNGNIFTYFIVKIVVPAAASHTVTINFVSAESGTIRSDGAVLTVTNVGDNSSGIGYETFVSYDISSIPSNATITQVQMDLSNNDILGNPFSALGCIKAYHTTYTTPLAASAFVGFPPPSNEDHDWCSTGDLGTAQADNDFKAALQAKVGTSRLQYRYQFGSQTNGDGVDDAVRFGGFKLNVTYTTP